MRIIIGNDHRGYKAKNDLVPFLEQLGHEIQDAGVCENLALAHGVDDIDYPDIALIVGIKVSQGEADRGILICGSGIGMAIAANKIHGIRAATCHDEFTVEMSRRHNNVNILCLAAEVDACRIDHASIEYLVEIWLKTDFDGGRHARRVDKITQMES